MEDKKKIEIAELRINFDKLLIENNLFEKNKQLEIEKLKNEVELERLKKSSQGSIVQKGILIALIGLLATLIGAVINGYNSKKIEEEKFYTGLVTKAFDVETPEQKAENLKILISSGLLTADKNEELKKIIFSEDIKKYPEVLDNFKNSDYSNLEFPFAIRNSFNCSYSIEDSNLVISIKNLFLTQLRPRPFYPTIIHGVRVFLYVKYKNYDWESLYESEIHPINVIFEKKFNYKKEKIDFKIPIGTIEKADDYFVGLDVLSLYDGELGSSNTRTDINVKIE